MEFQIITFKITHATDVAAKAKAMAELEALQRRVSGGIPGDRHGIPNDDGSDEDEEDGDEYR